MTEAVRAALLAYFIAHGYPAPQINAIDRYVYEESRYDYRVQAWSGACAFQWAGIRRYRVMRRGHGTCPSLSDQLRIADYELRIDPTYNCFMRAPPRAAYAVLRRVFGRGAGC